VCHYHGDEPVFSPISRGRTTYMPPCSRFGYRLLGSCTIKTTSSRPPYSFGMIGMQVCAHRAVAFDLERLAVRHLQLQIVPAGREVNRVQPNAFLAVGFFIAVVGPQAGIPLESLSREIGRVVFQFNHADILVFFWRE